MAVFSIIEAALFPFVYTAGVLGCQLLDSSMCQNKNAIGEEGNG